MSEVASAANVLRNLAVSRLGQFAGVSALVADRIFDEPPEKAAPPYIYVGPINRQRLEIGCGTGAQIRMRLFAVSTEFGRDKAWDVADAMWEALDEYLPQDQGDSEFRLQGPLQVLQAGDVIDPLNPKSTFIDILATLAKA